MESIRSQLKAGENILWEGRPRAGLRLRRGDGFIVPFSILWAGFALFWNVNVWVQDAPLLFRLWGAPFLLAGAYICVGRLWVDSWQRARMRYAVTNRRILIADRSGSKLSTLDITRLPFLDLDAGDDGTGTIRFTPDSYGDMAYGRRDWIFGSTSGSLPRFVDIPDARSVFALIQQAAGTAS